MLQASQKKFRPILMTSIASVIGMLPGAFGRGIDYEIRSSCGIGVVGGLAVEARTDGGMESGFDAFKALALGADAVTVGRPLMEPLKERGAAGVRDVLETKTRQLQVMMYRTASKDLKHIDPSVRPAMQLSDFFQLSCDVV